MTAKDMINENDIEIHMNPTITVILPCYNHARYVRAAVESVLRQTLTDIEVIAIDDASTDGTAEVLDSIVDDRLVVIRHEHNMGSAQTINEGIKRAGAQYVAILNSDDVFHPTRLSECMALMLERKCLLIGTDLELIDTNGTVNLDRSFWWNEWYRSLREQLRMTGDLIGTLILGNIFISTSNFIIDKTLFGSVGYLSDYRYVQDYEFLLRCLTIHPDRVYWLEKPLWQYRLHDKNTILEDQLIPAKQTVEVLAKWMPELAVGEHAKSRLHLYERHILRLSEYIENGARNRLVLEMQQTRQTLDETVAKYNSEIDLLRNERQQLLHVNKSANDELGGLRLQCQELKDSLVAVERELQVTRTESQVTKAELARLYRSPSFRLGYALLQPARWLLAKLQG